MDLLKAFHVNEADPVELRQILGGHFKMSTHKTLNEIVYPADTKEYALKVTYNKKGDFTGICAGPKLQEEDVTAIKNRIENELLVSAGTRIGTEVLFSHISVTGYFRYKEKFQILPVPSQAPRPSFLAADHPFLVEFGFQASSSWMINNLRRAKKARELELLLAGLLGSTIHSIGKIARNHWVLLPDRKPDQQQSAYCQEMYTYVGPRGETDVFASIDGLDLLRTVQAAEFYNQRGIGSDSQFDLPDNFEKQLDTFFELSPMKQQQFLRACFWYQYANRIHSYSRSAAFSAVISAIETLMPDEEEGEPKCRECGKTMKGVTQRFADFVDSLAPHTGQANRKKLYRLRSQLSHGGSLLLSDFEMLEHGLTPAGTKEWMDIDEVWQLLRIILVNWLSTHAS